MPLSNKFGYNSFKTRASTEAETPLILNITPSLTSNDTVATFSITSNRPNAPVYYRITGATADDFNAGILTGNITLDSGGNSTVNLTANLTPLTSSNTIVTDKSFNMEILSNYISTKVLATSSNVNLTANVFITADGGNVYTTAGPQTDTVYKYHEFFFNTASNMFTVSNTGTDTDRDDLDWLLVGGGGSGYTSTSISNMWAGGQPAGGGGGAVNYATISAPNTGNYICNVGLGGAQKTFSNPSDAQRNQNGFPSNITLGNTVIATGNGGAQGTHTGSSIGSTNAYGDTGGNSSFGKLGSQSIRYSPLGTPSGVWYRGGGGAGGGRIGNAGNPTVGPPGRGADGGAGRQWPADGNYYGGGGGGSAPYQTTPQFPGSIANIYVYVGYGGTGGGGRGGLNPYHDDAESGAFGTGGGGGGGSGDGRIWNNPTGFNGTSQGGSGTIKFRYEWKAPSRTLNLS